MWTDRVVPMLPERFVKWHLLAQSSSRSLTQSAIMEIDKHGRVVELHHYTNGYQD